jgi:broad specificity phosphatase PhoE
MDEELRVLARLHRIEALEREGASPSAMLEEVRGLLADAEDWVEAEPGGTERAAAALERCRAAFAARREVATV